MNSKSLSRAAIVSGDKTTSKSTLPFPSFPGNADILPSNLFALPLRTATGLPHPKSLLYIGNLGELPIVTDAPSAFPSGNNRGAFSQSPMPPRTVASLCAATFRWIKVPHQPKSLDRSSPTRATFGMLCIAFPK
uniref:Uncharacterized protein n=1 Tax=Cucumis sativus TaxID=3659 RepID=A0A0A0KZW3_CUCSA